MKRFVLSYYSVILLLLFSLSNCNESITGDSDITSTEQKDEITFTDGISVKDGMIKFENSDIFEKTRKNFTEFDYERFSTWANKNGIELFEAKYHEADLAYASYMEMGQQESFYKDYKHFIQPDIEWGYIRKIPFTTISAFINEDGFFSSVRLGYDFFRYSSHQKFFDSQYFIS